MSYTVLARKYRPQTFADLIGQEHVTKTLSNAITSGRVAHAFLFTGVRGVGKTTSARILAKALNCASGPGPTPTPCNVCDPCKEITAGVDLDVLEMDGASNNSVEDVRRLQETIPFRPARDRFKIVIVDEVHMLSTGAFNAFLKTLEEPPPHVKFIFATTEIHKVPVTIRSRCQRYDFRLIPASVVATRVREILAAEKIKADDAAVSIVAREAGGSMRDALTLLDQIVAFGGDDIRGADVARALGIADRKIVRDVLAGVLGGDGASVLRAIDAVTDQGTDMAYFARQLLELIRDLVVIRVAGADQALEESPPEERADLMALAEGAELLELQRAFSGMSLLVDEVAGSQAPRTILEMGLVRLATRPPLRAIGELLSRLEELEKKLGGEGGRSSGRGSTSGGSAPPPRTRSEAPPKPEGPRVSRSQPQENQDFSVPAFLIPGGAPRAQKEVKTAPTKPSAEAVDDDPATESALRPQPTPPNPPAPILEEAPLKAEVVAREESPKPQDPPPAPESSSTPADVWERIIVLLRDKKPALAAVLEHGVPLHVDATKIALGFPKGDFFGQQASEEAARDNLRDAAAQILGKPPRIDIVLGADTSSGTTVRQLEEQRAATAREETRKRALSHPRVVEAMQIFAVAAEKVEVRTEE